MLRPLADILTDVLADLGIDVEPVGAGKASDEKARGCDGHLFDPRKFAVENHGSFAVRRFGRFWCVENTKKIALTGGVDHG